MTTTEQWGTEATAVVAAAERHSSETLAAYREAPWYVLEHANMERAAIEGGYGRRQLFELIQNGADELIETPGKIHVVLTERALYCANEGRPLTAEGVGALLSAYRSPKMGVEIGRFGLGFKSVLAITTCPEIFSRSGSIAFDPCDAAERIRAIVADAERLPVLRLARSIDADTAADEDETLSELMRWATTVVRLARDTPDSSWLPDDLKAFPAEFLLFSLHVEELVLEDRENGLLRTIKSRQDGEAYMLEVDGEVSAWRVFAIEHHPSDTARDDAGAMADRERIPLVWAVPSQRSGRGAFWAFFPTLDQTTLAGVVNAPWKLNEDRTRIIEGPFNDELLRRVALIVLEHLDVLCPAEDPGVLLELMTARGREAQGWADDRLTTYVNDLAKKARSVPDQEGKLVYPSEIQLHPAGLPRPTLQLWSEQPTRPLDWAHPSVESIVRRARIEMYMAPREASTIQEWLEALVPDETPIDGSVAALTVGAALIRFDPSHYNAVRQARVFLDSKGTLRDGDGLFENGNTALAVDAEFIDQDVQRALDKPQLETLGIREVEPERLLEVKIRQLGKNTGTAEWDELWALVRECPSASAVQVIQRLIRDPLALRARNGKGEYKSLRQLVLPNPLVDGDGEDAGVVLDTRFHAKEERVIQHLGVPTSPQREGGSRREPFFIEYRRLAQASYLEHVHAAGSAPNPDLLDFQDRPFAGPLTPLMLLQPDAAARWTRAVLQCADDLEPWIFRHTSMARYPEVEWENPIVYMVKRRGMFETELGVCPTDRCVGPGLAKFAGLLPVALGVSDDHATRLDLPNTVAELRDADWQKGLESVLRADDDRLIGAFYAAAAGAGCPPPEEIRARTGPGHGVHPPEAVAVSHDADLIAVLDKTGEPFIRVVDEAQRQLLSERWGLRDAAASVQSEVFATASGEAEVLADKFPLLRNRLDDELRQLLVQPCEELRIERFTEHGRVGDRRDVIRDGGILYYRGDMNDPTLLRALDARLSLGLGDGDIDAIVRNLAARRVRELEKQIRAAADDPTRLLLAIGEDDLRARIPKATLDAVTAMEGELDAHGHAELALTVHGPRVLQEYKDVLEQRGLQPPYQWAGGRNAVRFVRELGFGKEYAGFESRGYERDEQVEGPPDLGALHDYQEIVVGELRDLLRGSNGNRGLLSLPTGAGKTRVTIEALVDALAGGDLESPILWVAQTEELCEQAIETWSEIWRGKGPRERLTISRLRAQFEIVEAERGHQVVVATTAKLDAPNGVFKKSTYDWLRNARCIVVDEAHRSVGPSYTRLLEWQGIGTNRQRDKPLIGLTATPFRGSNEAETKRLVARYGHRRLDLAALGSEDAYPALQRRGMLSHVDHALLEGAEIRLSATELDELKRLRQLPDGAARKLAADVDRNRTLIDHISEQPDDWPVLLFAVSVDHAHTMAALLNRVGISAAAISSNTDKGSRRHYVEAFRRGGIRVLANYDVLTAGFDAPRVRAVYIARPTYAPNTYQQMIGRGLRGPANGGTERCLLVNVEDNVLQFGDRLAFHEFDYLWESDGS